MDTKWPPSKQNWMQFLSEQVKSRKGNLPYSTLQGIAWCTWCIKIMVFAVWETKNNKKKIREELMQEAF